MGRGTVSWTIWAMASVGPSQVVGEPRRGSPQRDAHDRSRTGRPTRGTGRDQSAPPVLLVEPASSSWPSRTNTKVRPDPGPGRDPGSREPEWNGASGSGTDRAERPGAAAPTPRTRHDRLHPPSHRRRRPRRPRDPARTHRLHPSGHRGRGRRRERRRGRRRRPCAHGRRRPHGRPDARAGRGGGHLAHPRPGRGHQGPAADHLRRRLLPRRRARRRGERLPAQDHAAGADRRGHPHGPLRRQGPVPRTGRPRA